MSKGIVSKILEHPDKDEILSKLLSDVPITDIYEFLKARYIGPDEQKFIISEKSLSTFKKEYLDIYQIMRDDIAKTKSNMTTSQEQLEFEIQGSPAYHKALEKYINSEVDIKTIIKKLVVNAETRIAEIYDIIREDPRNIKIDRTLIEWFNTLAGILEKYDTILNGNPEQINIQNNINIQVLDKHINVVYDIIREILAKLDYEVSLQFVDMFNEAMAKLKNEQISNLSIETRLAEANKLSDQMLKLQ